MYKWRIVLFPIPTLAGAADKPNILFVFIDHIGWGDPSCYGSLVTNKLGAPVAPHLDTSAAEGIRFTEGYVASPHLFPVAGGGPDGNRAGALRWKQVTLPPDHPQHAFLQLEVMQSNGTTIATFAFQQASSGGGVIPFGGNPWILNPIFANLTATNNLPPAPVRQSFFRDYTTW